MDKLLDSTVCDFGKQQGCASEFRCVGAEAHLGPAVMEQEEEISCRSIKLLS